MLSSYFILTLVLSVGVGYGIYRVLLHCVPLYLLSHPKHLAGRIEAEAVKQSQTLLKQKHVNKQLERAHQDLESELQASYETLSCETEFLQARKDELRHHEQQLKQQEEQVRNLEDGLLRVEKQLSDTQEQWQRSCDQIHYTLAEKAQESCDEVLTRLENQYVHHHTLEYQKVNQFMESELNAQARKKAAMVLTNVHARYSPDFSWPKVSHVICELKKGDIETLVEKHSDLIDELKELSGVEISTISDKSSEKTPEKTNPDRIIALKCAGGFGIHKEATKLTLSQWLSHHKSRQTEFVLKDIYFQHLRRLNQEARRLGQKAVTNLNLRDVHPELQYLIGALNWRTSYRQNQWFHTMEVAVLAGIIAEEIGEDSHAAKRSGLLHDIGKALDYRIEGSHAVISGDYADRFGESKLVCDTVMSHHSDLVVENPLAFTLMAADTLSGARPGARVNIEEGYQLRLSSISETVKSFPGVDHLNIMNGGREVHVSVHHQKVSDDEARQLARHIAEKIEEDVSYPSQIKVQVSRTVQSQSVA